MLLCVAEVVREIGRVDAIVNDCLATSPQPSCAPIVPLQAAYVHEQIQAAKNNPIEGHLELLLPAVERCRMEDLDLSRSMCGESCGERGIQRWVRVRADDYLDFMSVDELRYRPHRSEVKL